jgi:hypothetical protein
MEQEDAYQSVGAEPIGHVNNKTFQLPIGEQAGEIGFGSPDRGAVELVRALSELRDARHCPGADRLDVDFECQRRKEVLQSECFFARTFPREFLPVPLGTLRIFLRWSCPVGGPDVIQKSGEIGRGRQLEGQHLGTVGLDLRTRNGIVIEQDETVQAEA